ncbi:vWA domain-containing protein [Streptomyces sp. CA-135486]|uniref:vWA domain-containing protein n=1 Tax=Streptomyces sp. CA-135486 TaxID=3240049 RepID=UPI003D8EA158
MRKLTVLLMAALCVLAGPLADPVSAQGSVAQSEGIEPVDFVVLVDASASLDRQDLNREAQAAALLGQAEISDRSRATFIAFGSAEKSGQRPVNEICPPTVVDAVGRKKLTECARRLNSRASLNLGPGTDFPAALNQALRRLADGGHPSGAPKMIFLLTDGRLDVRDVPSYGSDTVEREANGIRAMHAVLNQAQKDQVQIWPLGFGEELDKRALWEIAANGYQKGCSDLPEAVPRAHIVADSSEVEAALQLAFAVARCARVAHGNVGSPATELKINIPPLAAAGSITVTKGDPSISVTYFDPMGRKAPLAGTFDGSVFSVSGRDGPVEALRVTAPLPGTWRITLHAPGGLAAKAASVGAMWQGSLHSSVSMEPASPRPKEEVRVRVRLQTGRGMLVTSASQLNGVKAGALLTGDGFSPTKVVLRDDGTSGDEKPNDLQFTGWFTVPSTATGKLQLTTDTKAPGMLPDRRPLTTSVSAASRRLFLAGISLDTHLTHPGGRVHGRLLIVRNDDNRPHTLQLSLEDQPTDAALRISPRTVTIPPGLKDPVPFTVSFSAGTEFGEVGGKIVITDATDADRRLGAEFLSVTIGSTPTWWDRWWWAVTTCAVLLLVVASLWLARHREYLRLLVLGLALATPLGAGVLGSEIPERDDP